MKLLINKIPIGIFCIFCSIVYYIKSQPFIVSFLFPATDKNYLIIPRFYLVTFN